MATSVLRKCLDAQKLAEVKKETIAFSQSALLKWMSKRDTSQLKSLQAEFGKPLQLDTAIHYFKLMVKRDAKVKLDSTCLTKHPAAQNIMFHAKAVNALFSPCFDEFKNRFMSCLLPHIVFFTEMDNRAFASVARGVLGRCAQELFVGEVDFSKFDKSQDIFIKEFERCVYSQLGFDHELLDLWMQGEYQGKATTLDHQLSFNVECQRRSGAANTWIGNSVVTLGILSMYYDLAKMQGVFISGDDSLIFSSQKLSNHSEAICLETGFEAKFMSPSVPYFCSKFLVFCEHKFFFVPDPYKLIVKLGQVRSEVEDTDLFEIFTSFKDLTKDMHDERVLEYLARLVEEKYNVKSRCVLSALHAVHCLGSNFSSFKKLFPKQKGWLTFSRISKSLLQKISLGVLEQEKYSTAFGENYFLSYMSDDA
uniref:ORF2 n=1 Tax=Carrot yellow leaf virus TaxID=656190 RepID=A0A0A0P5K6_9CLOS|nr:ORF2 [Carrot yellow leaf virus]